jgi:hypothetical protein
VFYASVLSVWRTEVRPTEELFNLKTSVELYCERLTLEFAVFFAEFWLTVVVTTAFTKIQQKTLQIRRLSRSRYEFN